MYNFFPRDTGRAGVGGFDMNLELVNLLVVVIGVVLTLLINWERLISAPRWLIALVIGAASGIVFGYFM